MKIQLKEDQVQKLIGNYKSLNEQGVRLLGFNPETKTETVNFNSVWNAGYWKMTSKQIQNLNSQMMVIQDFLSNNPQTKLSIQVEAGESKVTNADNESGGKSVPEGYLSTKRGESLVNYLNNFFKKLENGGMSFTYPVIPKAKTIVGSQSYVRGTDNPKDPKYTPEQFVRLKVTATSQSECLIGLEVMIGWIKSKGHSCDQAIFQLLMNKVPLGIANLNNGKFDVGEKQMQTEIPKDVLSPVKNRISTINKEQVRSAIAQERKRFSAWVKDPKNRSTSGQERKFMDGYSFNGKTIRQIGGYPTYLALVKSYYNKNKPNQLTYKGTDVFDEDYINKMVTASKDTAYPLTSSYVGYLKKRAVFNMTFEFDPSRTDSLTTFHDKITNQAGRTSDKVVGGKRTQTFKIDTALAKEIFAKGKGNQNKITLSMIPLVGPSGKYKQYYTTGSHSDVPYVRIKKDGESDNRYSGYPSVSIARGDLQEVTLLETDLCGNPITAKNQ
tara:strand:+ start:5491 stop:6981 length:1491 start_codon:yes stop_codon:yes gene_type:complete